MSGEVAEAETGYVASIGQVVLMTMAEREEEAAEAEIYA